MLDDVFRAQQAGGTQRVADQPRTALVAGACGRLGEALLNAVLARGRYQRVIALADAPMSLGIRTLELADLAGLHAIDDVYLLPADEGSPASRSFYGRDAAFTLVTKEELAAIGRAAVQAGARRMLLVQPLPAWQQISKFHAGLTSTVESVLAALPLHTLVVMRPVAASGAGAGASWLQRVVHAYLSVQLLMLPRSIPTLTSERIAQAAVLALTRAQPGTTVMLAETIARLLESPAAPP